MELTVERGRGYVSAVQNKAAGQEIGRDPGRLDLLAGAQGHLPRRGHPRRADDQLRPADPRRRDQAVDDARATRWPPPARRCVDLFGLAQELNAEAEGIDIGPSPAEGALAADLALPIEEMDLSVRSYNCLKREGIHTVGELITRSEADLLDIRNFGAKSIDEVKEQAARDGPGAQGLPARVRPAPASADSYGGDDFDGSTTRPTRPDGRSARRRTHAHPHQGAPPRRQPAAPAADAGQPGHGAVRARPDHHDPGQGEARCARWPSG